MDQNNQNCEEMGIDLSQYIKVIAKRKKTLIVVFLVTLAIGFANILFSPKIYRISMMLQPPVIGPSLTGANDLESAENLKNLIVNGAYNEELKKILNIDLDKNNLNFNVVIPNKTNILQVSIDLGYKQKEFGVDVLQGLNKAISNRFAKSIEAKAVDISNQIKLNERHIINAKEKAKNISEQMKEITLREDRLLGELKSRNLTTAQIWEKRDLYLKENPSSGNSPALFLASYLQNDSNYLNQLNNQLSDLSMRRVNLNLELKNTDSQINEFQVMINKLNIDKDFILNLKIIAQPKVSPNPISSGKKRTLAISVIMGLFLGILATFVQEFWVNNLVKK